MQNDIDLMNEYLDYRTRFLDLTPDKLFKTVYQTSIQNTKMNHIVGDRLKGGLTVMKLENPKNKVITIEFNENYYNYHYVKSAMTDITNILFYVLQNFEHIDLKRELKKIDLKLINNNWKLYINDKIIQFDDEAFRKMKFINIHVNYRDMNDVINIYNSNNDFLNEIQNSIVESMELKSGKFYIIHDNNGVTKIPIFAKTFNEYINFVIQTHFKLAKKQEGDCKDILIKMDRDAKVYEDMFEGNVIHLNRNGNYALQNPDGLLFE